MLRVSKRLVAGMVAGAVLVGGTGTVLAQTASTTSTTNTSSTSTTSTTVLPHEFSDATDDCLHQARRDLKACNHGGGTKCRSAYETAYANCFAAPGGVKCAKSCVTRETSCITAAPATRKKCRRSCRTTRRADVKACRLIADGSKLWGGGDAGCLTTAAASYDLCKFVCTEAIRDCRTTRKFCVANCENL